MINILEEVVEEESKENEVNETEEKPEEAKPEPEPEPDPKVEEGMLLFPIDAESIYHIAYLSNYFDFHVCLSLRPLSVRPSSVCVSEN